MKQLKKSDTPDDSRRLPRIRKKPAAVKNIKSKTPVAKKTPIKKSPVQKEKAAGKPVAVIAGRRRPAKKPAKYTVDMIDPRNKKKKKQAASTSVSFFKQAQK